MDSNELKVIIYILIYVVISNIKNEIYSFALDCILTKYIPNIKNTLRVIKTVHTFLVTAQECVKSRNFMSFTEKLANMAIELALIINYQKNESDFAIHDVNVCLLQLVKLK